MRTYTATALVRVLDVKTGPYSDRRKATDVNGCIVDGVVMTTATPPPNTGYKCHFCEFHPVGNHCDQLACAPIQRSDKQDVIFIKLV